MGYRFYQIHWEEPVTLRNGRVQYPLVAKLLVQCQYVEAYGVVSHLSIPYRARLTFDFTVVGGLLFYFNRSLKLSTERAD